MTREEAIVVERFYREEIVSRALIEGYPICAGIFAENHFRVFPDLICLEWDWLKLGRLKDPAGLVKNVEPILAKLGVKCRVTVTEANQ